MWRWRFAAPYHQRSYTRLQTANGTDEERAGYEGIDDNAQGYHKDAHKDQDFDGAPGMRGKTIQRLNIYDDQPWRIDQRASRADHCGFRQIMLICIDHIHGIRLAN